MKSVQMGVGSIDIDQFVVCTSLGQLPVLEHDDVRSFRNGQEIVGDDDGRPVFHQPPQGNHHAFRGRRVESSRGLIKDQHWCILHHGAGDGNRLSLTAGKARAALSNQRVVALRQPHDEVMRIGRSGRALDLGIGRSWPSEDDVVANRASEQE